MHLEDTKDISEPSQNTTLFIPYKLTFSKARPRYTYRARSVGSASTCEHDGDMKKFQKIVLHFGDQTAKLNGEHNSL